MIGESFDKYVEENKKTRKEQTLGCLNLLRKFNDDNIKQNTCVFLRTLSLLLELINAKNPYDIIYLEEIGTDQKEIQGFEEKCILIE